MKKIQFSLLVFSLLIFLLPSGLQAQEEELLDEFGSFDVTNPMEQQSGLGALLGLTDIGGQQFVGMRVQPDFNFGKIGFGLDIPLLFSLEDGKFRTEEFKDGIGWLRMMRYFRYGVKKRDPFYIRVGDLTGTYIGYGMLVDNYSNSISFEKRKLGASFDILIGNLVGIEGMYSDFDMSSFNLMAIRPYVKPFGRTRIPIIRTMDFGFTYVTDHDQTKIETDSSVYQNEFIKDGMKAWALDVGIMPVSNSFMQLKIYAQYGNLLKNKSQLLQDSIEKYIDQIGTNGFEGDSITMRNYDASHGFGVGVDFKIKTEGNTFRLDVKLERLWYEKYFMPQFFNAGYEFNKDNKLFALTQTDAKKGIYGALAITALDKIMIGGSLMIPDNVSEIAPAVLTVDFDGSKLFEKFILQGQYIKGGLTGLDDAFKLDERSLMQARAAYRLYKFLVIGFDYKWTWSKMEDGTFRADNYMTPYIGFQMPFNFGQKNNPAGLDEEN
ncbi:MAG: hypothetical protein U0W24_21110 [Bacteroidales bacterium]